VATLKGYTTGYVLIPLDEEARQAVVSGENTLAVHVTRTDDGQSLDARLVQVQERGAGGSPRPRSFRKDPQTGVTDMAHPRATLALVAVLAGGVAGAPALYGQSPGGRTGTLVVLNKEPGTATFVDVATGARLATLPTGPAPHELAMSSDGRRAVATNYGGNTLTVLNVAGLEVVRTIDLGEHRRPHGAFFLPGDTLLAVTSETSRMVLLVNVNAGTVAATLGTGAGGSHMVAITGDGSTLYTGNISDGTVSRLDVASGTLARTYSVPPEPEAITVTRDGRQVWVGSNEQGVISLLDTETGEVETALDGFGWPYRILLVPERSLVVIPDLEGNLVRFADLATRDAVGRIELPDAAPQGVALSGDRGTLFLSLNGKGQVAVIDLGTRTVTRTLEVGRTPDGIGWSPLRLRE
jgi:DNA-binding beta-propeller fold protein YncE